MYDHKRGKNLLAESFVFVVAADTTEVPAKRLHTIEVARILRAKG